MHNAATNLYRLFGFQFYGKITPKQSAIGHGCAQFRIVENRVSQFTTILSNINSSSAIFCIHSMPYLMLCSTLETGNITVNTLSVIVNKHCASTCKKVLVKYERFTSIYLVQLVSYSAWPNKLHLGD